MRAGRRGLEELISSCDCVVSVLPDWEETRGLLSLQVLSGAVEGGLLLVNVGRGSLIEDTVLIQALHKGYIRAAVLDVFNTEPLPQNSPLWSLPQVNKSKRTNSFYYET
jgi:phosphoglycerate dehydrogenase-like enzyme